MDDLTRQVVDNSQRLTETGRRSVIVHCSGEEHSARSVNGEANIFFPTDGLLMNISLYQFKLIINGGVKRNTNDFAIGVKVPNGNNTYSSFASWTTAFRAGTAIDQDGYHGATCWDYAAAFWAAQTGRTLITGGNRGVKNSWIISASRATNTGTEFTEITSWSSLKQGDWIVWTNDGAGHIAMATSAPSGDTIQVLDQNSTGAPFPAGGRALVNRTANRNDSYGTFVGAWRYKKWQ